jgi:hypothetical protein
MTKLPKPVELNPSANSVLGYTEAQMLQFRRDALEKAALLMETQHTWLTNISAANLVRKLKDET